MAELSGVDICTPEQPAWTQCAPAPSASAAVWRVAWCGCYATQNSSPTASAWSDERGCQPALHYRSLVLWRKPEPEAAVFRQNPGEPKPRFFGAKWIRFSLRTFVFLYGTKPMSWFRRGDWRYLQSLQRWLNLPIKYLSSYAHALKVHRKRE